MKTNVFRISVFTLFACLLSACVDERYDLNNVDMTIGTSGDLTLPTSSTANIVLKNILDFEKDGVVQSINGEYFIVEDGEADVPKINITPISIASPRLSNISTKISIDEIIGNTRSAFNISPANISILGYDINIPNQTFFYTIKETDKVYYEINVLSSKVPNEVIDLSSVSFVDETTLEAQIKVSLDKDYAFINKVHLDNLKLTIPKGLHVAHAKLRLWTDVNGNIQLKDEDAIEIDNENGIIYLTDTDKNVILDETHVIGVLITLDRAVTSAEGFTFNNGKVGLKGLFKIDGTFRLETADFELNENTLSKEQIQSLISNMDFNVIRPQMITFNGNASFNDDIQVSSFSGKVQSSIGNIAPIVLDNMPDFLNEPEVRLDLANPAIFVEVNNPLPAEAETGMTLTSIYSDVEPIIKKTGKIIIPANKHVVFCLTENPSAVVNIPEAYAALEIIPIQIEGLGDLLEILPKEIRIDVDDVMMNIKDLPVPSEYTLGVSYQVYTPLEFGEGFRLVYQGTEEGIGDDLDDINKIDVKAIRIDATIVTDLPLDLTLSLNVFDRNNESLKDKLFTVNDIKINGHKGPEAISSQSIALNLMPMKGHTIGKLLGRLDKFHYRAVAEASGNGILKEDAQIKLENISITLVGGISYDAN